MEPEYNPMSAKAALETYFLENRARLLEITSFLDRIDRYRESSEAKADFRYRAFEEALKLVVASDKDRTTKVQRLFSDPSTEPIESAVGLKAFGACEDAYHEDH
ncbi:MAG: hypothetical protein GY697_24030 [Desulfobacterales bacterium]|nr:hypothetical protein [Desulfobacterales bacterium]